MSFGGGGSSGTTRTETQQTPSYTGEQSAAQNQLYNRLTSTLQTGGEWIPHFAPSDWQKQTGAETYNNLGATLTAMNYPGWMQSSQQAINANPATDPARLAAMNPGASNAAMGMMPGLTPQASALAQTMPWYQGTAMGYGGPGAGGAYTNTPQGVMAYDPTQALQGAQNYMSRIMAPSIQQGMVGGGYGASSGANIEAMTNAAAQLALPINQQVMQNQAQWYNPQMQATLQGGLAQQGAQNQMIYGTQGAAQGAQLATQNAQNQFLGNQQTGGIQGALGFQGAQNAMAQAQQATGLQGLLNQGQNQFAYQMALPSQQSQFLNNIMGAGQGRMDIAGMDQQAQLAARLNQQQQYMSALNSMGALGAGSPTVNSVSTQSGPGGGFSGSRVLGGAATGAMIGSAFAPGIGTGLGALGGGLLGLF